MTRRRVKVYCLPHAGGGAAAYLPWRRAAHARGLEIVPVEPPGRGSRCHEALPTRMSDITRGLSDVLAERSPEEPYVLFGHSMGASAAYETACTLARRGKPLPTALVVSGSAPPGGDDAAAMGRLDDQALLSRMTALGGTPGPLLRKEGMAEEVLRVFRADLRVLARYHATVSPLALTCPLLALAGGDDTQAPARVVAGWRTLAAGDFDQRVLPGGHFFPFIRCRDGAQSVVEVLAGLVDRCQTR